MTSDEQLHFRGDNDQGPDMWQRQASRCQSKRPHEGRFEPRVAHSHAGGLTPLLYSISEVCQLLRIGRTTLFAEVAAGELAPVKIHARTLFRPSDVAAYVERKRAQTTRRRRPASHPRRNVDGDKWL